MNSGRQYLKPKHLEDSTYLEDCQVSCMIQIGDKLVIADNQTSQPEVKLFGAQCKQLDKVTLDKSRIKDLTSTKNNTLAALIVISHWLSSHEYYIVLMEVTQEEKLTVLEQIEFKYEITALHFAKNLYFLACRDPKPCIKLYSKKMNEVVYTIKRKYLLDKTLSKIHVDDNYRMIVSDSTYQKLVIFDYDPATHEVTPLTDQKFHAFHIEPIPDGTILLATAANTSIVRLFPNAKSADNNFKETGCYPCGVAYNKDTGKLRIVVEKKRTFWDIFIFNKKKYMVLTYQCELRTYTETIIDM